jgi:ATP-dependent exoDNAse (exonuclease V) alpha subunit
MIITAPRQLDPSQEAALQRMYDGKNVFLTGNAGTGKTTVITEFLKHDPDSVAVTATTGIAALNLRDQIMVTTGQSNNAMTIYRWSGIGIGPFNNAYQGYEDNEECYKRLYQEMKRVPFMYSRPQAIKRICECNILIIDEISMLPGKTLNFLDFWFRKVRNQDVPFGGIQVIFVGDFLQLPPVAKTGKYDWAFTSKAWKEADLVPAVLRRIHRQDADAFKKVLNAVRVGKIGNEESAILQKRVARFPQSTLMRLYTHNVQVDKFNNMMLDLIERQEFTFNMWDTGHSGCAWIRENLICPEKLVLKVGARVMVTVNLSDGIVNGTIGTVTYVCQSDETVQIRTDDAKDGDAITIGRHKWDVNPGLDHLGHVTQIPLRLAWATTIHKSQGLSLDSALIDVRAAREPGQAYVALSRVRTLPGLHLKDTFSGVFVSQDAINYTNAIS